MWSYILGKKIYHLFARAVLRGRNTLHDKLIIYVEISPEKFAFHTLVYITWSLFLFEK